MKKLFMIISILGFSSCRASITPVRPGRLDFRVFKFEEHAAIIEEVASEKNGERAFEKVKQLIENGEMNPNQEAPDEFGGETFLHIAVSAESVALVNLLLKNGTNIVEDDDGKTPLDCARYYYYTFGDTNDLLEIMQILEKQLGVTEENIVQKPSRLGYLFSWVACRFFG